MPTEKDVAEWRELLARAHSDPGWMETQEVLRARRPVVRAAISDLLERFLTGKIDVETFRATFDTRTRREWETFGLKGMAFAMFLNKLVKHISDEGELTAQLRAALRDPESPNLGRQSMERFAEWLETLIQQGQVTRVAIQPGRAATFISAFWHMQAIEKWPVYYPSARLALESTEAFKASTDPVESYFRFRSVFQTLQKAVGVDSWTFEQLCSWKMNRAAPAESSAGIEPAVFVEDPEERSVGAEPASAHTHAQWLLARLGQKFGYQIWIAANDRSRSYDGTRLGTFSVDRLSLGIDEDSLRAIKLIDVLWLQRKQVAAAFEVEHTTSIYSGLLRLSDLVTLSPNINFPLYIVTPRGRMNDVERELNRPTFQSLDLHKICGFLAEEDLVENFDAMQRWATDAGAIRKLARFVEDRA